MRIRHVMASILGAAIVLIVVLALPSLAHAHAGHHHAPAATKAVDTAAAPAAMVETEAEPAPVRSLTMPTVRDSATPCGGMTCCTKACSACGLALSGSAPVVEPQWIRVSSALPDTGVPAAAGPDDLSRPPKPLARI